MDPFHLAFPVHSLSEARRFYRDILDSPEGHPARIGSILIFLAIKSLRIWSKIMTKILVPILLMVTKYQYDILGSY